MNKAKRRRALFRIALRRRRILPYNFAIRHRNTMTDAKLVNTLRCYRWYWPELAELDPNRQPL
jgi:5-methylcytosine-specific restriction endonuclease McrBC GTP-binding regulatory subunit McrB